MARGGEISREGYRMLAGFGKTVRREWRRPDHGIWEIRGETRHYTYSKVACWAALDCLAQVAREGGLSAVPVEDLCRERDEIRDWIEGKGFDHDIGSYTGSFGSRDADASLLLMSRYRYCDANDPRMTGTFAYLESELASGALMYRYRGGFDRLKDDEHPFGICSFWVVDYLARAGRLEEAAARFETLLGYCNDLGLYGEQIEAGTGAAMGNFPQAFTHVGLISAAVSLAEAGEQRDRGVGR
jgi:GH15 family glucan-1,4-alpha-glucosidase